MLSSTAEYALRASVFLAEHEQSPSTSTLIADGTQVPHGYLMKILQQMVRAGLVASQRGTGGGFVLARPAEKISVLEVLQSVDEAPRRICRCPLGLPEHEKLCPIHKLVDETTEQIERAFSSASLGSLAASTFGIPAKVRAAVPALAPPRRETAS